MRFIEKITEWYFTKKVLPYWCILLLDCLIVLFSALIGSYIEIGNDCLTHVWRPTVYGIVCCLPLYVMCFYLFHTYQGIIRFSSYVDLYRIAKATLIASIMSCGLGYLTTSLNIISTESVQVKLSTLSPNIILPSFKSALIIFCISTFLMWIVRLAVKASFENLRTDKACPAAIYGTQAGGIALANSIRSVKDKQYIIRAFISDRKEREGILLFGKKVFLNEEGIAEKLLKEEVQVLLVSPLKSVVFRNNQRLVNEITNAGIRIMMMPEAEEWDGKSDLSLTHFREVEIEDLLPRDKIEVDMLAIGSMLRGKRILITGAAGSIGSEIVRQVAIYKPSELILIDQAETPMHDIRLMMARLFSDVKNETIVGSITDEIHMKKIFCEHKPEFVFHAAAYKHVPMMEIIQQWPFETM